MHRAGVKLVLAGHWHRNQWRGTATWRWWYRDRWDTRSGMILRGSGSSSSPAGSPRSIGTSPRLTYDHPMAKPSIVTVDDDPQVLNAVERDLRARYAADYRIVGATSGTEALEAVLALKTRGDEVALFLADQRMPTMTGTEFLLKAAPSYPNARTVLLTAYADTDAAIQAINDVGLDHYLLKPWSPRRDRLYPVLDELLEDWQASTDAPLRRDSGAPAPRGRQPPTRPRISWPATRSRTGSSTSNATRTPRRSSPPAAGICRWSCSRTGFPRSSRPAHPGVERGHADGSRVHLLRPHRGWCRTGRPRRRRVRASEGLRTAVIERDATGGQAGMSSRIENYLDSPLGSPAPTWRAGRHPGAAPRRRDHHRGVT